MKCLHLTVVAFCHILLTSLVLYFTGLSLASPISSPPHSSPAAALSSEANKQPQALQAPLKAQVAIHQQPAAASSHQQQQHQHQMTERMVDIPAKVQHQEAPVVKKVDAVAQPQHSSLQVAADQMTARSERVVQLVPAVVQAIPTAADSVTKQQADQPAVVAMVPVVVDSKADQPKLVVPSEPAKAKEVHSVKLLHMDSTDKVHEKPQQATVVKAADSPLTKRSDSKQPVAVVAVILSPPLANFQKIAQEPAANQMLDARKDAAAPVRQSGKSAESNKSPVAVVKEDSIEPKKDVSSQLVGRSAMSAPVVEPLKAQDSVQADPKEAAKTHDVMVKSAVVKQPMDQRQSKKDAAAASVQPPVVRGGLGPLHLLATTLCSYQPDKQVADENLNQLYARRAAVRRSLFDFMSLKFTNLEKLSSRLGLGLQVVPVKSVPLEQGQQSASAGAGSSPAAPSHGWPVVGKCTAHDLKLMGEAAWCEYDAVAQPQHSPSDAEVATQVADEKPAADNDAPVKAAAAPRASGARHLFGESMSQLLPTPEQSSVISKLLRINDVKEAPVSVESTIYNLNLTQQQLATLEAHTTSTRECRRNALRYTKALFNHLAEDQQIASESWPSLYSVITADDCARKRMIDIMNALASFRTDTTSIRRDNLEFAFAMDDLRTKVLDNEVNVPLTFDKQFIEVEQFLQQSVRLMLSNIDPKRAKLTSMRYRSLMYGATPNSADDQCIELHQRLMTKSYPTDCNPTQFGQLPDVLRMTASSLELWSIEKELSLHMAKVFDYPNSNAVGQQKVNEDVNECIGNLVAS